jgi:hypothetical protein
VDEADAAAAAGFGTPGPADAGVELVAPPDAAPVPPPVVTKVVLVNSKPQGALVYRDDQKLGKTPLNVEVTLAKPLTIIVKRNRYEDAEVVLEGSEKKLTVKLDRVQRKKPPKEPDATGESEADKAERLRRAEEERRRREQEAANNGNNGDTGNTGDDSDILE